MEAGFLGFTGRLNTNTNNIGCNNNPDPDTIADQTPILVPKSEPQPDIDPVCGPNSDCDPNSFQPFIKHC